MGYLRIIIEHEEVDFEKVDGFPVSMVFTLDAVEDVRRLSGFFTKKGILLTASDTVRELFGFYEEVGVNNSVDLEFKNFQIESGGLPVLSGRCRLRNVDLEDGGYFMVGRSYYVDFLGNNVTWFEDLKKLKLRDLGFESHSFTEAVISSKLDETYSTGDFGYMPVKMKEWESDGKIMWKEFVPFLFIKSILREIFRNVGLELVSEFFDYEPIERLVMPVFFQQNYSKEFFLENTDVRATLGSTIVLEESDNDLIFDDDSSGENFDNGGNYNTGTGVYSVPMAGRYKFDIRFSADFDGGLAGGAIVIIVNSIEVVAVNLNNEFGAVYPSNYFVQTLNLFLGDVGVDIEFKLRLGGYSGVGDITIDDVVFRVEMQEVSNELGATVNFNYLLRDDWTADKFVLGLKDAFNLMIDSRTEEGKVYIEPMDRYVIKWKDSAGVDQTIEGEGYFKVGDKTDKTIDVDLNEGAKLKSLVNDFTEFYLKWKVDSETVAGLDDGENIGMYDSKYLLNENRHRKGDKKIENAFFAKMLALMDTRIMSDDSVVTPQFPVLWPYDYLEGGGAWLVGDGDDGETSDYDYDLEFGRMLYFAGQRGGIDGRIVNENDVDIDLPFGFMVNYNDDTNGDFSLSFGNELLLNGVRSLGLMHVFYLHYLKRLDEGKRFDGSVFWTDIEIMGLDFRKKILLNNVNFILRKINGWIADDEGSVKTVMDMDLIPEEGDEENVVNSAVDGFIVD